MVERRLSRCTLGRQREEVKCITLIDESNVWSGFSPTSHSSFAWRRMESANAYIERLKVGGMRRRAANICINSESEPATESVLQLFASLRLSLEKKNETTAVIRSPWSVPTRLRSQRAGIERIHQIPGFNWDPRLDRRIWMPDRYETMC